MPEGLTIIYFAGDSGGSIDYKDSTNGRWYALGVTSHGISCGQRNQPGVYSKVTKFLTWIQGNTGIANSLSPTLTNTV